MRGLKVDVLMEYSDIFLLSFYIKNNFDVFLSNSNCCLLDMCHHQRELLSENQKCMLNSLAE